MQTLNCEHSGGFPPLYHFPLSFFYIPPHPTFTSLPEVSTSQCKVTSGLLSLPCCPAMVTCHNRQPPPSAPASSSPPRSFFPPVCTVSTPVCQGQEYCEAPAELRLLTSKSTQQDRRAEGGRERRGRSPGKEGRRMGKRWTTRGRRGEKSITLEDMKTARVGIRVQLQARMSTIFPKE